MEKKRLDITDERARERILEALGAGGVVILPTDTLYGFSTPISSEGGIQRIVSIKGNGEERKFLFLASSVQMVKGYIASWGCADPLWLEEIWPAPFTAIFPSGKNCPSWIGDTIAIRVPDFPPLIRILDDLGEPITSSSVNRAGEPPLRDADEIARHFEAKVDLIVTGGEIAQVLSSTIVDFTGELPVLIREGGYPWEV